MVEDIIVAVVVVGLLVFAFSLALREDKRLKKEKEEIAEFRVVLLDRLYDIGKSLRSLRHD